MSEHAAILSQDWTRFSKLPDAPWISLQVILNFVQGGWAYQTSNVRLCDLPSFPTDETGQWRRKGALLAHCPPHTSNYDDPAINNFDIALTNAGLNGSVKFRGVKYEGSATDIEDILTSYFDTQRFFGPMSVSNTMISGKGENGRRERHWKNVTIERKGFLTWLRLEYPAIFRLHAEATNSCDSIDAKQLIQVTPAIKDAYKQRVADYKNRGLQPTRLEDESFMREHHRISRTSTRELRRKHAPEWNIRGRRKKLAEK